ncbi:Tyrosine recombinase XerC [uncultured Candidatus Thioglobus sp.]|nr:Tyrosine recombinase XerC [uncultured Candidatus Thioglobus sp.]
MDKYIDNFIDYLKIERQYAQNTCQAYQRDLGKLLEFAKSKRINQWSKLSAEDINLLMMQIRHKGISPRSMRRYLSSIHGFLTYLMHRGVVKHNCSIDLKTPKIDKNLPDTLDYNQVLMMLKLQTNNPSEQRDVAMIEVLYSCGLRVSELVGLDVVDVDFNEGFLRVLGKGAKVRYTPLGQAAQIALKNYLQQHNQQALFLNNKNSRISTRSVENIVKNRALAVGIKVNVYPHMLRHAAATHFLQSSHDLRVTQDFLGHKSIKSTQVYTHLDFQELAKTYDNCHPRSKREAKK